MGFHSETLLYSHIHLPFPLTLRLDTQQACERLMSGFLQSYNASTLRKAAQDLKGLLIKPKWQLPPNNVVREYDSFERTHIFLEYRDATFPTILGFPTIW